MTRVKLVLLLIVTAAISMVIGAAGATAFTGAFLSDATDSRFIADATLYLTTLEKMRAGDSMGADAAMKQQLTLAIRGLRADSVRLSPGQRKKYVAIQNKAAQLKIDLDSQ
jgi:hypothetical protein